ncbi:hypothetical protein CPB86DRAFT_178961 [Serendipita vermifera]|nr:hypothetical protein CPB86DRAFT_178961 [Serendipita vermifera]
MSTRITRTSSTDLCASTTTQCWFSTFSAKDHSKSNVPSPKYYPCAHRAAKRVGLILLASHLSSPFVIFLFRCVGWTREMRLRHPSMYNTRSRFHFYPFSVWSTSFHPQRELER